MKLKSIIKESSLSRIWSHVTKHESGTISAWRSAKDCGDGEPLTKSEKSGRNAQLKSKLLSMGYGVTAIQGVYIENYGTDSAKNVKEDSFIVIDLKDKGNLKKDLINLGKFFEQDSITWSKPNGDYFLISTNECPNGYPGRGRVGVATKLGKPFFGQDGEMHSTVSGRPFVITQIGSNIAEMTKLSMSEIRSVMEISKEVKLED